MSSIILEDASYYAIRTNPKLTGNVKLISNNIDLYLESFNANKELSSSKFKSYKIDGRSTYDIDVHRFFSSGKFPKELAYEVFQEYRDYSVLSDYGNQYEMFYSTGVRSILSESYTEDLGLLAPIWLNENIPNYFVVFRVDGPSSITTDNNNFLVNTTAEKFNEFILNNCTAIKTFDLTENSTLGSYLRRYRNKTDFPKAPLTVNWGRDSQIFWNGISYDKGGFISKGLYLYDELISKDSTIIQNEFFFTKGFQLNGILLANLINLEFLFSDTTADDYSINRYFGLYLNELEEGYFNLSSEGFYKGTEKTQTPKINGINDISYNLNTELLIENKNGVLLYVDENSVNTTTGLPTDKRVAEVDSIFYVKDKDNQFHTIKKGYTWKDNQIRLFDKIIDISKLTGFKNPDTVTTAEIINEKSTSVFTLTINNAISEGMSISFYDDTELLATISGNNSITAGAGTSFERFFNTTGTTNEIASAIKKAVNIGIKKDNRFFDCYINGSNLYFKSRYAGSRFNKLRVKINFDEYPDEFDNISTYPEITLNNLFANFIGGNDKIGAQLKVNQGDQDRFSIGNFVKTKDGFSKIINWVPYLREPVFDIKGNQISFNSINEYVIIITDNNNINLTSLKQISLYSEYKPTFGRFSFYPVKDFDFDFYSEEYGELGELDAEISNYNQTTDGLYYGVNGWPDIRDFYDAGGFYNLIGLLKDADPNIEYDIDIASEYDRLEENYLKEQSISSRIIPYINKWGWYKNGKNVRNKSYRLNLNLAFGVNNFAPSKWNSDRSPDGYSHEWYYLSEFPNYFNEEDIKKSWSYFNSTPNDNIPENFETDTPFQLGTFQNVDNNYFDEYFIVDHFIYDNKIIHIPKQFRYGKFSGGDTENFAETFLRGVRIIVKPKSNFLELPNFNAKKLSYVKDGRFNGYKFSTMLIVNEENKGRNEIKIIKNEKWKTIVLLVFVKLKNECLHPDKSIDRTTLYALNNSYKTNLMCDVDENIEYENSIMQGAISFSSSYYESSIGQFLIQGISDIVGNKTDFFRDIKIGIDGQFNSIQFTFKNDVYTIEEITRIVSKDKLYCNKVTKNGYNIFLPASFPKDSELSSLTYTVIGGGYNEYVDVLNYVSFSNIFNLINSGSPEVIYETVDSNGNIIKNADGSLASTFMIELRVQDDILKSTYLDIRPDQNKPTVFNLTNIIGYELTLNNKPSVNPIARHSGWYEPIAKDVIFFNDPYIDIYEYAINGVLTANIQFQSNQYLTTSGNITGDESTSTSTSTGTYYNGPNNQIPDLNYKLSAYFISKNKNTQFSTTNHDYFCKIFNFFYHKVNKENSSSILELSQNSAFLSLYPLINEVGISYKDFYLFSSNWDPYYFTKSLDKSKIDFVRGIESMKEKKSFFGSKFIKLPDQILLEKFIPNEYVQDAISDYNSIDGTFMYIENSSNIEFFLFIEKSLRQYLFDNMGEKFKQYLKNIYGEINNIDDLVYSYIDKNIISIFKISRIIFFVKYDTVNTGTNYNTAEFSNSEKAAAGLSVYSNIRSQSFNNVPLDLKIIYNKRSGFSESFGFSILLVKK